MLYDFQLDAMEYWIGNVGVRIAAVRFVLIFLQ